MKTETPPEREVLGIPFAKNLHPLRIFDRETLHFLEVNDAAGRRYGFSREEFLTMTCPTSVPLRMCRNYSNQPKIRDYEAKAQGSGGDI